MRQSIQKGFTLIELMIVVAIIGILAAIAIPAYQDYTIRAQVTEGLSLVSQVKVSVAEAYTTNGAYPADGGAIGLDPTKPISGKYVTGVDLGDANGVITVTFGNQANATKLATETLSLAPYANANGDISWICGLAKATNANEATAAAAETAATAGTSVAAKYLPATCRG